MTGMKQRPGLDLNTIVTTFVSCEQGTTFGYVLIVSATDWPFHCAPVVVLNCYLACPTSLSMV